MDDSIKIIENGFVFTGDENNLAGRFTVLIRNDRIIDIGKSAQTLKAMYPAAEIIDASGNVLFPGFVDAHHTGDSFILRYLTAGYPMSQWNKNPAINNAFDYLRNEATYEEMLKLYRLSYFSAVKSGVTALAEYGLDNPEYSFPAIVGAMQQSNLKGLIGLHNSDQVEAAKKLQGNRFRFGYVIEDEEKLTTYDFQSTIRLVHEFGWPIILHLGQTRRACDLIKKKFHKSIVRLCSEYKIFDYPVHITHLAYLEEKDFDIIADAGASLVISPSAILRKETDMPPFEELIKHKINIVLGTDWGPAQPLENLRMYSSILKYLGLPVEEGHSLLALHTINSARVLGLDKEIGSLEVGKKADIVFLDLSGFRMRTILSDKNPERILNIVLQESNSELISDVMINGDLFVQKGNLLSCSEDNLTNDAQSLFYKFNQVGERLSGSAQQATAALPIGIQNINKKMILTEDMLTKEGPGVEHNGSEPSNADDKSGSSSIMKSELPKNVRKIFGDDDI